MLTCTVDIIIGKIILLFYFRQKMRILFINYKWALKYKIWRKKKTISCFDTYVLSYEEHARARKKCA